MNIMGMDDLYANFGVGLGWLSRLLETFHLSPAEIQYLEWRDQQDQWSRNRLKQWDAEIDGFGGQDIYFEADAAKQFVKLTELIATPLPADILRKLETTRFRLREEIMGQANPDWVSEVSDSDIEKARSYPLRKLFGFLRSKNIKCPYHDDSNPSFQVGIWGFCHTCHKHVNSIDYLMDKRNLTFLQSVKNLANR